MDFVFEITDKTGRKIHLTKERWTHIKKHSHMDENMMEELKKILKEGSIIRYSEDNENVLFYYREFKKMPSEERYLFVSVKYLNNEGFVVTSFFTNKITGLKWMKK